MILLPRVQREETPLLLRQLVTFMISINFSVKGLLQFHFHKSNQLTNLTKPLKKKSRSSMISQKVDGNAAIALTTISKEEINVTDVRRTNLTMISKENLTICSWESKKRKL